jgi:hypothetical protein
MLSYMLPAGSTGEGAILCHTRTLAEILGDVGAPSRIDYLSMDLEGGEVEALNGFPWDRYRFDAITLEVHHGRAWAEPLLATLHAQGYARTGTFFSDWFLRRGGVEGSDQEWIDDVLGHTMPEAYRIKPEVAHIPWIKEWKRKRDTGT